MAGAAAGLPIVVVQTLGIAVGLSFPLTLLLQALPAGEGRGGGGGPRDEVLIEPHISVKLNLTDAVASAVKWVIELVYAKGAIIVSTCQVLTVYYSDAQLGSGVAGTETR